MSAAFRLAGVTHEYRAGLVALDTIDLEIEDGQHVAVTGANGSGKSTLLKMLDGLVFPSSGTIEALGRTLSEEALEEPGFRREFRSTVGFVFQEADVQLFCPNAFDELAFGPLQMGLSEDEVRRRVTYAAEQLNIGGLLDRPPYTLSGGEKKRVAIASVISMEPHVLLMDEPTNALDPRSQVWLMDVLDDWKQAGRTVVLATHDLGIAAESADRMVVLSEDHRVAADGPPGEVLKQRDLLLDVNLIHEHEHRHGAGARPHTHAHAHGHGHSHETGTDEDGSLAEG